MKLRKSVIESFCLLADDDTSIQYNIFEVYKQFCEGYEEVEGEQWVVHAPQKLTITFWKSMILCKKIGDRIQKIAEMGNIGKVTIRQILHDQLYMTEVGIKMVPKSSWEQKDDRQQICIDILRCVES